MKLNDMAVRKAKPESKPYKIADGAGHVLLEVMPNGSKYWRFKYRFGGKENVSRFRRLSRRAPEPGAQPARGGPQAAGERSRSGHGQTAVQARKQGKRGKQLRGYRPRVVCKVFPSVGAFPCRQDYQAFAKRCFPLDREQTHRRHHAPSIAGGHPSYRNPGRTGYSAPREAELRPGIPLCSGHRKSGAGPLAGLEGCNTVYQKKSFRLDH